jgi:hypothetical protein
MISSDSCNGLVECCCMTDWLNLACCWLRRVQHLPPGIPDNLFAEPTTALVNTSMCVAD